MAYLVKGVSRFRSGYRAVFQEESGGPRVFRVLKSRDEEAAAIEAELMAASGLRPESGDFSLGDAIEERLAILEENADVIPDTLAGYSRVFRRIGSFCRTPVRNIRRSTLQAYVDMRLAEGAAPNTLRQEVSLIRASLSPYLASGAIDASCFKLLDLPERQLPGPAMPSPADVAKLLDMLEILQGKVGLAARLAVQTESLAAEVVGIRWADLPESCSSVAIRRRIARSGHVLELDHPREHRLSPSLAALLRSTRDLQQRKGCRAHYVLTGSSEPMKAMTLSKKFTALSEALGISCSFSALKRLARPEVA